jgi:hypothetical protein
MSAMLKSYACAALLLLGNGAIRAQELDAELGQAVQLYQDGEWEAATLALTQLLETGHLSRGQRTRARQILAEAYISLRQPEKAVEAYKQIVRDDRTFNMRSLGEDPDARLLRHLGQAVLEVREEERRELEVQLSKVSRGAALARSALLPGWGQRYQGYIWRGHVMLAMTLSSMAYAVLAEKDFRKARDGYENARDEFDQRYDQYTRKADRADLALGIVGALWAANMLDAVFQRPALPRVGTAVELAPTRDGPGLQVALVQRF